MPRHVMLMVMFALILASLPSANSQTDDQCTTLVTEALQIVGSACAAMSQDEACYGHTAVTVTFREGVNGTFAASGDVVSLLDLAALFTRPADPTSGEWGIAMLTVQADLPAASMPLTLVVFGDAALEAPAPDEALCTATNNAAYNINLRGDPSTTAPIVGMVASGESVGVLGYDGEWLYISAAGAMGWIFAPLVETDCVMEDLPAAPAPMNAFTLQSGTTTACEEAPNGLLVRSPTGQRAHLIINGVELEMASAGFITAQPDATLTVQGLEGQINVTAFAQTVTVTPGTLTTVPLVGLQADGPPTAPVEVETISGLDALVTLASDEELVTAAEDCVITITQTTNLRAGPGLSYDRTGQLSAGDSAPAIAQAIGLDNVRWWQLAYRAWVRSDVVDSTGACDAVLAQTSIPSPPVPPIRRDNSYDIRRCGLSLTHGTGPIAAGQVIEFQYNFDGVYPDGATARSVLGDSYGMSINGRSLAAWSAITDNGAVAGLSHSDWWVATSGTHAVSAYWGPFSDTCTLVIP